jgi:hypothetical protein
MVTDFVGAVAVLHLPKFPAGCASCSAAVITSRTTPMIRPSLGLNSGAALMRSPRISLAISPTVKPCDRRTPSVQPSG